MAKAKLAKRLRKTTLNGNGDGNRICSVDGPRGGLWENLSPEILALIFVLLPVEEMMRVIPLVCKSWRDAVAGPYCWSDIDIERWCRRCKRTRRISTVVRRLVRRSKGMCRRLSAFKINDPAFSCVGSCARSLKVLQIPMSLASDKMVKKYAQSLKMLTYLDISYCLKITCNGLEALGKSCTSLVHLRRNLPPIDFDWTPRDEGEAMIIAETMPGLQRLELAYGRFSDLGLDAILTKCKNLTHLDIQGSLRVKLKGDLRYSCNRLVEFTGPLDNDLFDSDDD